MNKFVIKIFCDYKLDWLGVGLVFEWPLYVGVGRLNGHSFSGEIINCETNCKNIMEANLHDQIEMTKSRVST